MPERNPVAPSNARDVSDDAEINAVDATASEASAALPLDGRSSLETVMARVQQLEDEGRMVEASALMVESMRLRAEAGGGDMPPKAT